MSDLAQQLLDQVLRLPLKEREDFATRVLSSLDLQSPSDPTALEDELRRRIESDDRTDIAWEDLQAETDAKHGYK